MGASSGEHGDGMRFWILKRCLPGQRAAASEWNQFFTEVCERYGFINFRGTIFKHKEEMAFISVHIDDVWVAGTKEYINKFHAELSKGAHEAVLQESGTLPNSYAKMIWWTGEA